jgi:hypothetical protein
VSVKETLELNQPHIFKHDLRGDIVLEDSLIFAVKNNLEKQKLIEMAFKLTPIIEKINFENP